MHNIDEISMISAKIDALTKNFEALKCNINAMSQAYMSCEICGAAHMSTDYPLVEQANYISNANKQQNNPFSNTYNPGWRNHPNFSWGGQGNQGKFSHSWANQGAQAHAPTQQHPPGFQPHNSSNFLQGPFRQEQRQPAGWELAIEKLANGTVQRFEKLESKIDQIVGVTKNLEAQFSQFASGANSRPKGTLPSQPEQNSKGQCNAVTLRNIKELGVSEKQVENKDESSAEGVPNSISLEKMVEEKATLNPYVKPYIPPILFPQRLQHKKIDKQYEKFLQIFRQLHIDIPFTDALAQMPVCVKFLKEILSNKRKLEDLETMSLNEECSAIIQRNIPPKLKDLGSFSLPCTIGKIQFVKALCDFGASVSLMLLSICKKLGFGKLKRTRMSLQLADRTIKHLESIIEDVLVKVDKFYIPCDFVVLETEEDLEVPIILGRPFLTTAGTNIDVRAGKHTLNVGDEKVEFDLNKVIKYPSLEEKCYKVDVIEETKGWHSKHFRRKKFEVGQKDEDGHTVIPNLGEIRKRRMLAISEIFEIVEKKNSAIFAQLCNLQHNSESFCTVVLFLHSCANTSLV